MLKVTPRSLIDKKKNKEKITCLTAYDAPTAMILDESGIDIILVGDSVGNVLLGYESTLPVTVDEMVHHIKAVRRGVKNALVIGDLPLSAFSSGDEAAFENSTKFIKAGAEAVKIEGTEHIALIKKLVSSGISVMGHIGFTPQSEDKAAMHGKTEEEAKKLLTDAKMLEDAGAASIVLELINSDAAGAISGSLKIPAIGIGSGPYCDGQVLVTHDILGLTQGKVPKFAKQYADLGSRFKKAVEDYVHEVRSGRFPI